MSEHDSPPAPEQAHEDATHAPVDTSFVVALDARQRAMLAEMGIKVWAPKATPAPTPTPETISAPPPTPTPASFTAAAVPTPSAPAPTPSRAAPATAPGISPDAASEPLATTARAALGQRPPGIETMDWASLEQAVSACQACGLCQTRTNTVFGVGDAQTDWLVVGEAPGENEDRQGEPFVGAAGQLLDNMLAAIGRSRKGKGPEGAFIANVLKCRPPANRNPLPEEVAQCEPFLRRQVALIQPRIILAMGRFAVQSLLQTQEPIGRLRGKVHQYEGVPVIVTYHPAYLLRSPSEKAKAWADLCLALDTLAASQG